jgi:Rad3-related DNA helicase
MVIHAPTGMGKTAATIAPALAFALENDLTVFFITPRHTQHLIALETMKLIKDKYGLKTSAVDFVGKKWYCTVPGIELLRSSEFAEYCKKQREDNKCEFYLKTRKSNKLTMECKNTLYKLLETNPSTSDEVKEICSEGDLCAYEVNLELGKKSTVVIADYLHLLNPHIRSNFMKRIDRGLDKSIIIIDEGHNVPNRVRELMTVNLSNFILKRAITESKNINPEITSALDILNKILEAYSHKTDKEEMLVKKEKFVQDVESNTGFDYQQLIDDLDLGAKVVLVTKKQSYCALVSIFLESWLGQEEGYVRIFSKIQSRKKDMIYSLSYRCLDPSLITKELIKESYSTIIMSGTLTPPGMYADLLGFDNVALHKFKSPFSEENKLTLIVPETTTKYSERTPEQFQNIAKICADITDAVPGNCALFFPSYYLRDEVYKSFSTKSTKTSFLEMSEMTKKEKQDFLEKFKQYKDSGAVLLGVMGGSFGEGIDLPGDLLKAVIIVGLPLQKPTLETDALISYYDEKFSKGMDYGYIFPAMNKTLQSAGRCIRTETDKGVIVFLDVRYVWSTYFRCFPLDWHVYVTKNYMEKIKDFFH